MSEVNNSQDVLDSRDIIELIDELESLVEEGDATDEDREELAILKSVAEEGEESSDWQYGETLIRDSYFTEYAMDLLSDIGDLPRDIPHYICIDEDATAENIKMDYTTIDFDGVEYWIRCC